MADDDAYDIGAKSTIYALTDTVAAPLDDTVLAAAGESSSARAGAGSIALSDRDEARYQYRGRLGQGGMGRVDWVWDADLMRDLAIKSLRDELRDDGELLRRFLWEARVTASLDHPNVVPVHDLGVTPRGHIYFTMKRVAGRSLAQLIRSLAGGDAETTAELPLPRRLRLFMQICQAMEFAHSRGILHRDLKPDNVMIGSHGEVLVMDWGLAAPLDAASELGAPASAGEVSGTPLYMSPEQAAGEVALDARADIYSLGAILYELCALDRPFEGTTMSEILERVRRGQVRPLSEVAPSLSPSLAAVIEKAMALNRDDRYASARALHVDVERVVDGRTPEAEHASIATRVARYAVREDRRLGALRPYQLDMLIGGSGAVGLALGTMVAPWVRAWAWPIIAVGILLTMPFMIVWVRSMLQDPGDA